tara:strand:+ start:2086 stop:3198 length:1113 start_codon:yes stop_codon:yes gene_type:complete
MKKEFSLYLDLMRFLAACLVVINHSNHRGIITEPLPQLGHSAVMIFFILSGFVIAYVSSTKEITLKKYSVSRIARIYSVVPIALVVTLMSDFIGEMLNPDFYSANSTYDYAVVRFLSSMFFLNEIWTISITTYSNVPFWSLNYEVWYYILFGITLFLTGKTKIIVLIFVCLLLGPKVILLAPIWWMGVYLYRSRFFNSLGESAGWLLFVLSLVLVVLFHYFDIRDLLGRQWLQSLIGSDNYRELAYSKSFLSDYLLAIIVFCNFAGFKAISHRFSSVLLPIASPIQYVASFTFILYLTHQPLIWLFKTIINGDPSAPFFLISIWASVLCTVWLLGQVTEQRKSMYRGWSETVFDRVVDIKLFFRKDHKCD